MWTEFKAFLVKANVLSLALAVIVGVAMGGLVTALVDDFLMPVVGALTPGGAWREIVIEIGPIRMLVGHFLGALLNFAIVSFVVWQISKAFIKPAPSPEAPATKTCPFCRMSIDALATRCAHCTSQLDTGVPGGVLPPAGVGARK